MSLCHNEAQRKNGSLLFRFPYDKLNIGGDLTTVRVKIFITILAINIYWRHGIIFKYYYGNNTVVVRALLHFSVIILLLPWETEWYWLYGPKDKIAN